MHQIFKALIFIIFFIGTLFCLILISQHITSNNLPDISYVEVKAGNDTLYDYRGKNSLLYTKNGITGEVVHYYLDDNFMRAPFFKTKRIHNSHIILDGCSFVFGEGEVPQV